MKKWVVKKNSTIKEEVGDPSRSESTHALSKSKGATPAVVPLASTEQTLAAKWSTAMSKEEWERISKLRCLRKPPAHLGVYYEQTGEGDGLGNTTKGKEGDESMATRLTATYAPPIIPNISPLQPHIDLSGSSTVGDEIIAEIEAEVEKEARGEAISRRGMFSKLEEGLTETSERNLEEVPLRIIKYKLSHDNKKDSWKSAIAIPASTPRVKIGKKFVNTLWKYSGEEGMEYWETLERFRQSCSIREEQDGVSTEIFRLVVFLHCLFGDALDWFKSLRIGSITEWAELKLAFLRRFAEPEELNAPAEVWFKWNVEKEKWKVDDYSDFRKIPTLDMAVENWVQKNRENEAKTGATDTTSMARKSSSHGSQKQM